MEEKLPGPEWDEVEAVVLPCISSSTKVPCCQRWRRSRWTPVGPWQPLVEKEDEEVAVAGGLSSYVVH
ncbi:hypothetical protein CRG98_048246 [Punica granatum]|uniref:Uncharacterized protein n=1 Tax=Punica granatum TaxID=22663 RepID=A0A2I0HIB7_PUNGR|nr:hypothetical protein CRG98_048246 [Punica granatum]